MGGDHPLRNTQRTIDTLLAIYEIGGMRYVPSTPRLGEALGVNQRTAYRHVQHLLEDGSLAYIPGAPQDGTRSMYITAQGKREIDAELERRRTAE